jgi:hypothetical protein
MHRYKVWVMTLPRHTPGTAKSELSRRLSGICGGAYFERLLTRFSVPEELFGPLSMKGGSMAGLTHELCSLLSLVLQVLCKATTDAAVIQRA